MSKLEGISELRGKIVELGNIENPVLRRVLSYRTDKNKFHFAAEINYEDELHVGYNDGRIPPKVEYCEYPSDVPSEEKYEEYHEVYNENGAIMHHDYGKIVGGENE